MDINSILVSTEYAYRTNKARRDVAQRRRIRDLKKYAARKWA